MPVRASLALVFLGVAVLPIACASGGARDAAGERRARRQPVDAAGAELLADVPPAKRPLVQAPGAAKKARLFARASARTLAIDESHVYFGDSENDAVYAAPKAGGDAIRLARHSPVAGAIALDAESIVWIASPGDSVLKLPRKGGTQPMTLRDRGIFSDVALANGDAFITEALGSGGALVRVTGPTAARIASLDGPPRAVMADATHVYVLTPTALYRTLQERGELETLATGVGFAHPQMDDEFVFVVCEVGKARVIGRIPKKGGSLTAIASDVRDVPFEVAGGEVLYLDAVRPQVRAVGSKGGDERVVLEDDALSAATSLVADDKTVYVATGSRESGAIVAADRY